jgi:hypothetical protein
MRQLWDERERFLKFERGWDDDHDDDIEELDLDDLLAKKLTTDEPKPPARHVDYGPNLDVDPEVKAKLDIVEDFYVSFALCKHIIALTVSSEKRYPIFSPWS